MITNKRVKELIIMNQKARARRDENAFLTEGTKMFMEAPTERIREIYVSESFFAKENVEPAILRKLEECGYETVPEQIFGKISDTRTPQGILCVIERRETDIKELLEAKQPLFMILEDIQDPGNLGTIIRTGAGAGVTGIILSRGCVDIYNPKTIRSTMGSVYRVPFFYTDHLSDILHTLKDQGTVLYAAHLLGTKSYDEVDYTENAHGTAFMIGNEGNGLADATASEASQYIKIPMKGEVESLNAAIAATLLMDETARQFRGKETNR